MWWGGGSSTPTTTSDPSSTAGGTTASGGSEDAANACPVGAWVLDNESWDDALTALWVAAAPDAAVDVTGSLLLDWRDSGSYLLTAEASQYVVTGVADGVAFEQTVRHDGTEGGAWSGSDANYSLVADDATGMTSVVTLSGAGGDHVIDQSTTAAAPWSGTMTVACTATGMTTTVTEASGSLAVTWHRR